MKNHNNPLRYNSWAILQRMGMKNRIAKNLLRANVEITPGLIEAIADIIWDGQRLLKLLKGTTHETRQDLESTAASTGSRRHGGSDNMAVRMLNGNPRTTGLLDRDCSRQPATVAPVGNQSDQRPELDHATEQ